MKSLWPDSFVEEANLCAEHLYSAQGAGRNGAEPALHHDGARPGVSLCPKGSRGLRRRDRSGAPESVCPAGDNKGREDSDRSPFPVDWFGCSVSGVLAGIGIPLLPAAADRPGDYNSNRRARRPPIHCGSWLSQPFRPSGRGVAVNGLSGNAEHRTGGRRKAASRFRGRHSRARNSIFL